MDLRSVACCPMVASTRPRGVYSQRKRIHGNRLPGVRKREAQCASRPATYSVLAHDHGVCAMNVTVMAPGERSRAGVPGISVAIPVYRIEKILPELVRRLNEVLPVMAAKREIILVNDCSPDTSWDAILQLAAAHPEIRPINLMRNYGQHNALLCGIRAASYDVIVTMDDDLQHPPEEIQKMLTTLSHGFDVVYGTPEQEQHGLGRDLASLATKMTLRNLVGAEIASQVSAFRAFRKQVADAFGQYRGSFVSIDVLLTWGTNRFAA